MKELSAREVDHVAHLARLEITPAEREAFSRQLGQILTYVEQLSAIDTEGVEPLLSVFGRSDVMREDEAHIPLGVERVLQNAPEEENEQFRIPQIISDDRSGGPFMGDT